MDTARKPAPISLYSEVKPQIFAIFLLNFLAGLATVAPVIAIIELIKTLMPITSGAQVDTARAWTIVAIAAFALVLRAALLVLAGGVSHIVDNNVQLSIRTRIVSHLSQVPLGWFDSGASGRVKKSVEDDVSALHQLLAHAIQDLMLAVTVPLVSLIYLFIIDWRFALISMIPLGVIAIAYPVMMRDYEEKYRQYDESLVALTSAVVEFVCGISVVKSYGDVGRSHRRFRQDVKRFVQFYSGWMRSTSLPQTVVEIASAPIVVLAFILVGALIIGPTASPISLVAALLLGLGLTAPYYQLGFTAQFLRDAFKARDSILALLSSPVISEAEAPESPADNTVEGINVSFAYTEGVEVLSEIALHCAPGTVTALVGPSGSGKSTLARLVPRFYDVDGGSMTVGGRDVKDIATDDLYRSIGFVFQDPYLLKTSVRDNIRLSQPDADDSAVEEAAKAAHIHERIAALPRGYDSVIGVDANLSGGEQQRISIARGLLSDAPILVLDEATAFADPDSEEAIQKALSVLAKDRTVLVIAHRLHTITNVDQILVMDRGRVCESGTHTELLAAGGLYTSLWNSYQGPFEEAHQ